MNIEELRPRARMERGTRNNLCDVPGVRVGHFTQAEGCRQTGITVIVPGAENPFFSKLACASFVLNGFGKSLGLVQVEELGTLETPIALTNTLNVGRVHDALVGHMIDACAQEDFVLRSVNPVVLECNDGDLNDIRTRSLGREELERAFQDAQEDFAQGAVGAGRGMICHGLKGGIGSASRVMEIGGRRYVLGALALANHGRKADLLLGGRALFAPDDSAACDKGSCILVIATNLPLTHRQLARVIRRGSVGLARLGSFIGHGSGEVFLGFSTANRMPHSGNAAFVSLEALQESLMDLPFRACAEAAEEAVFNALYFAETVTGRDGHTVLSLRDALRGLHP